MLAVLLSKDGVGEIAVPDAWPHYFLPKPPSLRSYWKSGDRPPGFLKWENTVRVFERMRRLGVDDSLVFYEERF